MCGDFDALERAISALKIPYCTLKSPNNAFKYRNKSHKSLTTLISSLLVALRLPALIANL